MTDPQTLVLVISTVETAEQAEQLASALVEGSLAACVQIDGPVISRYRWQGKTESTREYRLMIKSTFRAWPELKSDLAARHPYDEPEIIMLPVADAAEGYRDWVLEQTV